MQTIIRLASSGRNYVPPRSICGTELNKRFGQASFTDDRVWRTFVRAASLRPSDTVLELGSGDGGTTLELAPLCKKVVTLDCDARLVEDMKRRLALKELKTVEPLLGDAREVNYEALYNQHRPSVVVSNLPFEIALSVLTKATMSAVDPLRCLVSTMSDSTVDILTAPIGSKMYKRQSVMYRLLGRVDRIGNFPGSCVVPSFPGRFSIVRVTPVALPVMTRLRKRHGSRVFEELSAYADIVFARRNQSVHKALTDPKIVLNFSANMPNPQNLGPRNHVLGRAEKRKSAKGPKQTLVKARTEFVMETLNKLLPDFSLQPANRVDAIQHAKVLESLLDAGLWFHRQECPEEGSGRKDAGEERSIGTNPVSLNPVSKANVELGTKKKKGLYTSGPVHVLPHTTLDIVPSCRGLRIDNELVDECVIPVVS